MPEPVVDAYRLSGWVLLSHCPLSFPLVYRGEMKARVTVICKVPLMPAYPPVPLASQTGPVWTSHPEQVAWSRAGCALFSLASRAVALTLNVPFLSVTWM